VAAVFLVVLLILTASFLMTGLAVRAFRRSANASGAGSDTGQRDVAQPGNDAMLGSPTLTQLPPALATGLYVSDIRFNVDDLEKNRRGELTMRVFNGTGRTVEFSSLSGRMTFTAPNSADPQRKGTLPSPALRYDVAKVADPFQEWLLILEQHVPSQEADKLIAMLQDDVPIHFGLENLNISVFAQNDPKKVERLPLWYGVAIHRGFTFGRIINGVVNIGGTTTTGIT
jgi:hypothetical protein